MARLDKLYIGTNTKMFKTVSQTKDYLVKLKELTSNLDKSKMELFVIPSFTTLDSARQIILNNEIKIGAQNMCWEECGQFTGEISPLMLKELSVQVVELGHSERRHVLGETDDMIKKKVKAALTHDFTTLLCIGETLQEKEYGISDEILSMQLKIDLSLVKKEDAKKLWIAYEPVWAIGTQGIPADENYINNKHRIIKNVLCSIFGDEIGLDIPVLYGGSVNNENSKKFINQSNVDGLFIGRSAWEAENFTTIIRDVLPEFNKKKS